MSELNLSPMLPKHGQTYPHRVEILGIAMVPLFLSLTDLFNSMRLYEGFDHIVYNSTASLWPHYISLQLVCMLWPWHMHTYYNFIHFPINYMVPINVSFLYIYALTYSFAINQVITKISSHIIIITRYMANSRIALHLANIKWIKGLTAPQLVR